MGQVTETVQGAVQESSRVALEALLVNRIVVLDGAMGTRIQLHDLQEADFRGERYKAHPSPLLNLNDVLVLTRPEVIEAIHREYLDAGADIIETNTFNANSLVLADYGLEHEVYELNLHAAQVARRAVEAFEKEHGERRFVAGSIGPANRMASMSQDANDPAARSTTFDELRATYYEQARGLVDGGVDILLPETTFDTLNLKAALFAIAQLKEERGIDLPVIASVTFTQAGAQRTLTMQTLKAFWHSIENHDLLAVTINCALGPKDMRPHVQELARIAPIWFGCYPNAGLPNEFGGFDLSPEDMASILGEFAQEGWLNFAGGCCGTTPEHIKEIAEAVRGVAPRSRPQREALSTYCGLETYTIRPDSNFTMVGERTNVSGSRRFLRLIKKGEFEKATEIARQQAEGGANIIDVCLDDGLIDGPSAMTRFLNQLAAEPDVARLPIMVDSSDFEVLEAGLKCLQGKGIVNSLSLKDGEEEFLRRARLVRRYGASVLIMGFDEEKQATSIEHRVSIAERAYRILTEQVGFPPEDIIYDANVFPIATGIEEHDSNAVTFIEAVRLIKKTLPGMKTSGGISNVSFSYRGNDIVREAMHAVFLYHAIQAGLDMGIVNAGQLAVYDEIEPGLRERVEDVILNRRPDGTERLTELAETLQGKGKRREEDLGWREKPLGERLAHALLNGVVKFIDEDVGEALASYPTPLSIIEGPLMDGMSVVGDLFGAGKMFLPQVVKSARVMQKAVALLEPHMEQEEGTSRGKVVMATVKGDVHDIGKNIVGVVLACNGFDIIDLGVMVPADVILDACEREGADMVGLSGLITPSLHEMVYAAKEMERRKLSIPLLIGGATTSRRHTAVKIAPVYSGPVLHVLDASKSVGVVSTLLDATRRDALIETTAGEQARSREEFSARPTRQPLLSLEVARERRPQLALGDRPTPKQLGLVTVEPNIAALIPKIDWTPFFTTWELRGSYPSILDKPKVGPQARELKDNADALLERVVAEGWLNAKGVYGLFQAGSEGDDVVLEHDGTEFRFPMLRQQQGKAQPTGKPRPQLCLADYVTPRQSDLSDHVGAFVVTAGLGSAAAIKRFRDDHDEYNAILLQALADRLAEAFAEWLHEQVREAWGYEEVGTFTTQQLIKEAYRGIRPAPGYPACPDHRAKTHLFDLLDARARTGVDLTSSLAMTPPASVSGLYFAHPDAKYFAVGKIGRDQVEDIARRMGSTVEETERWLEPSLGY